MNKRTVIFDFDHTLFDRKKFFEEDLPDLIGVGREKFLSSYEENFKDSETKKVDYDFNRHLELLGKNNDLVKEKINKFFKDLEKYLKPGAIELLKKLKINGDNLILVSFGNIAWQEQKIKNIKALAEYFDEDRLIITDQGKEEIISEYVGEEEVVIVNDKIEESLLMEKAIGRKCQLCIIRGIYSKDKEFKGRLFEGLAEVEKELLPSEIKNETKRDPFKLK